MSVRRTLPILVSSLVLAGCMTGERPTLSSEVTTTGSEDVADPVIATLIDLLADPPRAAEPYVATFEVLKKFGDTTSEVVIARLGKRWSLTVDDLRYLDLAGTRSTCDLTSGECTDGFDESRVSDVLTSTGFTNDAAVARLRHDAETAVAEARASDSEYAGEAATCAEIDVPGGTELWCVSELGLVVLQDTADVRSELVSLTGDVPPTSFDRSS